MGLISTSTGWSSGWTGEPPAVSPAYICSVTGSTMSVVVPAKTGVCWLVALPEVGCLIKSSGAAASAEP